MSSSASSFRGKYIDVGGIRTHYLDEGSGEPVVLVHGGGAGADGYSNWMSTIPLMAHEVRVIAVDMVGFGKTAKPDPATYAYSQQARNEHLAGFLTRLGLKGATLVGNSMGGATAIGVAATRPELVGRLVLMGSAGVTRHLPPTLKPLIHYDFTREGMIALMRILCTERFQIDERIVDYRYAAAIEPEARRAYGDIMGWVRQQGGLYYEDDFIRQVQARTLVVNGKQDKVVPLGDAMRLIDLLPRSWAYFIPDCGHWAMLEHPRDFVSATLNFIRNAHD